MDLRVGRGRGGSGSEGGGRLAKIATLGRVLGTNLSPLAGRGADLEGEGTKSGRRGQR